MGDLLREGLKVKVWRNMEELGDLGVQYREKCERAGGAVPSTQGTV